LRGPINPVLAAWLNRSSSSNGSDQGVDDGRQLVLGRDDDPGLAPLELDGPGAELDGHYDLAGPVGLPAAPDGLLFVDTASINHGGTHSVDFREHGDAHAMAHRDNNMHATIIHCWLTRQCLYLLSQA
jgi:hypothetical protein